MKRAIKHPVSMFISKSALIIATAMLAAGTLSAQQSQDQDHPKHKKHEKHQHAPKTAATFIKEAAEGNLAEVQMGQLAQQKSQNAEIKELAQALVTHHSQANQQLQTVAQQQGAKLPTKPASHHERALKRLERLSGSQFDQEFATEQIRDHLKDIQKYEQSSKHLQDAALNQYIQQTLPVLRQHLQMAQQAARTVGVPQERISSLEKQYPEAAGGTSSQPQPGEAGQSGSQTTPPESQESQPYNR